MGNYCPEKRFWELFFYLLKPKLVYVYNLVGYTVLLAGVVWMSFIFYALVFFGSFHGYEPVLGVKVFELSVMTDLTLKVVGVGQKDFLRKKWFYFNPSKEFIKYGKNKTVPSKDLVPAWRTANARFYYVYEDPDGYAKSLNFNGANTSGLPADVLDARVEANDIKVFNAGANAFGKQLLYGILIGAVVAGALVFALYPFIMKGVH